LTRFCQDHCQGRDVPWIFHRIKALPWAGGRAVRQGRGEPASGEWSRIIALRPDWLAGSGGFACGYKLANDGRDTRALQHYLGHKSIQHTVRYSKLATDRFRDFWRD